MEIYNKLFDILNPDDLLLTANKRLIPFLYKSFACYQQTQQKQRWTTPLLFTLSQWLELQWEKQLLENHLFPFRLLSKQQEYVIWQKIINESGYFLLAKADTAKTAQQAWQLLHQAQLDYKSSVFKQNNETQTWQTWASTFTELVKTYRCLDVCRATNLLIQLFRKKILNPPRRIFLIGFTEIHSQHKELFQTLEKLHCKICHYSSTYQQAKRQRVSLANKETECLSMTLWAYQAWQAGKTNIACVVPNLVEQRTQLVDTFTEVFSELAGQPLNPPPYNIAAGNPLKEFSLIQTAVMIIRLKLVNSFSKTGELIRSPYLAYAQQEQVKRAQVDIYLRCYGENLVGLEQIILASKKLSCHQLSRLIENLAWQLKKYDPACLALPSHWAEHFVKKLQALGWPGERGLISSEFQLIARWSELLTELTGLDFILGNISEEDALQQFQELISSTLFQSKTTNEPPIQVLGLLDTAGICFDALWVMGLDDRTWPASAKPNPFIPYALQRQHKLPHASNERELHFASLLTQELKHSAKTIIFSHPAQAVDQILRPSLLISDIKLIELTDLKLPHYQSSAEKIWASSAWEYYTDEQGPALNVDKLFSAGSQLFQSQAACPFQAFARFRLAAHFYSFPQTGLNARDRGILLHQVLEKFWNSFKDQASLLQLPSLAIDKLIHAAIDSSLLDFSKKRPFVFKAHFMQIERRRLLAILKNIIHLEKQRPLFIQAAHEQKQHYTLGKLSLNLRIDRIDQLTDESQMIIDYKTGTPAKLNYLEERCDHPQLPLYCLAYAETVRSFAVMHIRSHAITLQGITAQESAIVQLTPLKKLKAPIVLQTWSDLLNHWQVLLEKLAQQFQEGFAEVDPKRGLTTCRQCDLQLLCRINHPVSYSQE